MHNQIIHIEQCGFLSTLQDSGQTNYLQFGVSKSGAMDIYAAKLANIIVGNSSTEVAIEITQAPHRFRFLKDALVAFAGGGLQPFVNEKLIPLCRPYYIQANSIVEMKQQIPGFRLYMAIAGGLDADLFLNSYATNLLVKAGGFKGRVLKKEDILSSKNVMNSFQKRLLQILKTGADLTISQETLDLQLKTIKVLRGAEWNYLTTEAQQKITSTAFTIGQQSNRMGYHLLGKDLQTNQACEIISSAVTQGTVQLTPSGKLIVLMADAQTVGGYPRVAQVCAADLSLLAQIKPGDQIHFQLIDLEQAEELYLKQAEQLINIKQTLEQLYAG